MIDRVRVEVKFDPVDVVFTIHDGTDVMINVRLVRPTGLDELEDFIMELKKALIWIYQERVNRL